MCWFAIAGFVGCAGWGWRFSSRFNPDLLGLVGTSQTQSSMSNGSDESDGADGSKKRKAESGEIEDEDEDELGRGEIASYSFSIANCKLGGTGCAPDAQGCARVAQRRGRQAYA